MPKVVFVHPEGRREEFDADPGLSVMRVAVDHLVEGIVAECGGDLSCATCHVYVDEDWLDRLEPMSSEEEDMLEVTAEVPTKASRLSCQVRCSTATDGIVVHIPRTQR